MSEEVKPLSLAAWKKKAVHPVTLASGAVVEIKVPNLPELAATGEFPNHLIDTAISVATGETEVTMDHVKKQAEFYRHLMVKTVVNPSLTLEDAADIPFEDVELLAAIATRQRDVDALGHHIGGLDQHEDWRRFRQVEY